MYKMLFHAHSGLGSLLLINALLLALVAIAAKVSPKAGLLKAARVMQVVDAACVGTTLLVGIPLWSASPLPASYAPLWVLMAPLAVAMVINSVFAKAAHKNVVAGDEASGSAWMGAQIVYGVLITAIFGGMHGLSVFVS